MRAIPLLALVAAIALAGCGGNEKKPAPKATTNAVATNAASGNPITAPVDYLGAVARAKKSAARTVDLAGLNQAIQLFHASEDRFPRDLNELVEQQYIPRLPTPPPGTRFVYDPRSGALRVVRQ